MLSGDIEWPPADEIASTALGQVSFLDPFCRLRSNTHLCRLLTVDSCQYLPLKFHRYVVFTAVVLLFLIEC